MASADNSVFSFSPLALGQGEECSAGAGYLVAKRVLDVVLAALGVLVISPLMLLIAVWVRLDSRGPAIYRQTRVGKDGGHFVLYKFRTMVASAEKETGPVWAAVADPRVTRAGRILRKVYLDEIPQLFNILKGDMSLVGPRPERPELYPACEKSVPGYSLRARVKPGLTSLAQVRQSHHASLDALRRKFAYDMFYIENRSFRMDATIILGTAALLWEEFRELTR